MATKLHLRNILSVDNDGLGHVITYEVREMYDLVGDDGFATTKSDLLERFRITWDELDGSGRTMASIRNDLVKKYDIDTRW